MVTCSLSWAICVSSGSRLPDITPTLQFVNRLKICTGKMGGLMVKQNWDFDLHKNPFHEIHYGDRVSIQVDWVMRMSTEDWTL